MIDNNKPTRGVQQGTKRAPYATKKIPTVTINFRVPESLREEIKGYLRPLVKEYVKQYSDGK